MGNMILLPSKKTRPRYREDRRNPAELLGLEGGASARGNSFYKRVRLCPREHALAAEAGLRKGGDYEALTQGLTFHLALETYYKAIQTWQASIELNDEGTRNRLASRGADDNYLFGGIASAEKAAWKSIEPLRNEPGYTETYEDIERMLAHYFDTYRRQDRWRIIAAEETLEYADDGQPAMKVRGPTKHDGFVDRPAKSPLTFTARLDLIVEDYERGGMWIVEHKTSKVITDDLLEGYQLDQQTLGQVWLMHQCVDLSQYPMLKGMIVNITSKHKTPRFERPMVCPSKYHLAAFEESMRAWNRMLPMYEQLGWPKALGNCTGPARYWQRCNFFDVCHGRPEASVTDLAREEPPFGFVRPDNWKDSAW